MDFKLEVIVLPVPGSSQGLHLVVDDIEAARDSRSPRSRRSSWAR